MFVKVLKRIKEFIEWLYEEPYTVDERNENIYAYSKDKYSSIKEITQELQKIKEENKNKTFVFMGVGFPDEPIDSIGPLIGTKIKDKVNGIVLGTMEEPLSKSTVFKEYDRIKSLENTCVICIDLSVTSRKKYLNSIKVGTHRIAPASGCGYKYTPIGNYGIHCILSLTPFDRNDYYDVSSFNNMVEIITTSIENVFGK